MKYIMRTCDGREDFASYVQKHIPNLITIKDDGQGPMKCFERALEEAGDDSAVHLEDDVILTKNFTDKLEKIVSSRPQMVCQFFSMRKADLEIGSRVENGSSFISALCFYLPAGMSRDLKKFFITWDRIKEHPTGLDLTPADFMKKHKMKYYIHIPNLVDHRIGKSKIDPRRSSKRISKTFLDPME